SASCSHHLSRDLLLEQVARAAAQQRAPLQLLAEGHQDLDHPIHPGIPESAYIKALFLHRTQE
ncbi:MAG: class I SAM-dependent rRNA methyltransferase, partial [Pseudomonadota bacterium]